MMKMASALLFAAVLSAQSEIGPPPGKLIDIGGRKLHINCTGSGSPVVVLEAGASAFAIDWSLVQPEIARTNRVCSYDRAGMGWSDPSKDVATAARIVRDLHALLSAAGEKPPYVLVGASVGGIYTRLFQIEHPEEVAGLVQVDPSSEDRLFTMYQGRGVTIASLTAEQYRSVFPQGSVTVPKRKPQTGAPFDRLPKELYETRVKLDERLIESMPERITHETLIESGEGERSALARLHEFSASKAKPLGDLPVVVLTRGVETSAEQQEVHAAIARQSTRSRHGVVEGAGHEIHLFQPAAVIQAIREVTPAR
jgi:pimeloyl-ACP methyl ester carboxylesterase